MTDIIKPIETVYKGYRFRSRLEARWAVFFDAFGLVWQYESEGYQLPNGWYLPDFHVKTFDQYYAWSFFEIKPLNNYKKERYTLLPNHVKIYSMKSQDFDKTERLCNDLAEMNKKPVYIMYGDPMDSVGHVFFWKGKNNHNPPINFLTFHTMKTVLGDNRIEIFNQTLIKARQARFEHGETP